MLYTFFNNSLIIEISSYLWSHILLTLFFSAHYIFIIVLKTKINSYNLVLKNLKKPLQTRSPSNIIKTCFYNENVEKRFTFYLLNYIKLYVIKKTKSSTKTRLHG